MMNTGIKSPEFLKDLERQYESWLSKTDFEKISAVSDDVLKKAIEKDLTYFSEMGVNEYTLYQKWDEVQTKYPTETISTIFCEDEVVMSDSGRWARTENLRKNIWQAEEPNDYMNIQPRFELTKGGEFTDLRVFTHTMLNNSNIGRNLHYLVVDDVTEKYLGVVSITSDFLDLKPRDDFIGWDREAKTYGMINHTAICSCIAPVQPFGFNYVGGKLLALLCLSDRVRKDWEERYGNKLVGMTTTSLYGKSKAGGLSQYDNLKYWKKMGFTQGKVSFGTSRTTQKMMLDWMIKNHPRKYFEWYVALRNEGTPYKRDHRNRCNAFVYSKLNIPVNIRETSHHRGIYFSPLYENTCEFLRGETTETIPSFEASEESLAELWKKKYARQRINSLVKNDRVSNGLLFYRDLAFMTWEEAKEKYLGDVGR